MTQTQAATTRFCARVIGLLMLIMGAIVVVRFEDIMLTMPAVLQDSALSFITGIFTLIVGLIVVAAHHHWSSPTAIAISLIGLLTVLRGVLLMLAPSMLAGMANQLLSTGAAPWIAGGIAILLGVWLSYEGWFANQPA